MNIQTIDPREWLGRNIREYYLAEIIGSGGMSAVFRGTHTKLKVDRAVKVLRPNLAKDKDFVRRFEQEAQLLAMLEHPNLIRVFEFFEEDGFLFIIMELAEGDSLEDLVLYHGVIPAREMWTIIHQAALGLEYTHSKGVVHRDLSPDNIMVAGYDDQKIRVKVIDFGIARQDAFDSESKKLMETGTTTTGSFLGKLRYCSPEQAMEMPVDHRSDQYSLALIFIESITGKATFEGGSPVTMLMRRVNEPPPRLIDLVPGSSWPSDVDRVLERAMQSSPVERYSSITGFTQELAKALGLDSDGNIRPKPTIENTRAKRKKVADPGTGPAGGDEENLELGITSLAETMNSKPDRTIYAHRSSTQTTPRYGRVEAPPPPKKRPWFLIICVFLLLACSVTYFVLPPETRNMLITRGKEVKQESVAWIDGLMRSAPTPTETPVKTVPKKTSQTSRMSNSGEPYWMDREGVKKPVIKNAGSVQLPDYFRQDYPPPFSVIVQTVILKEGLIGSATILNNVSPEIDKMALDTVKSWSFTRGYFKGKPADIMMDLEVEFR